jgi:coproporphyrinogen III oxidase
MQLLETSQQKQHDLHGKIKEVFRQMFDNTCQAIEQLDGKTFTDQSWVRENGQWVSGESDGVSVYVDRALNQGNVFEKIGVNYVAIKGELPPGMTFQNSGALATADADSQVSDQGTPYFATGTSFVIHPCNPMAPIAHCNYRYFQMGHSTEPDYWWFGGGADLTPAYLFEDDAVHFHKVHKDICDKYDPTYYPKFKEWCDKYFYIPHRGESRGVGGIFFDQLNNRPIEEHLEFVTDCTKAFATAYLPIVERCKEMDFTEANKQWQRIVRGRYVEFILTSDRGARFGLASGMVNHQSVFNCMPPAASWTYDDRPDLDTQEAKLREVLKAPRSWV